MKKLYYFFLENNYRDYQGHIEAKSDSEAYQILVTRFDNPMDIRLYLIGNQVKEAYAAIDDNPFFNQLHKDQRKYIVRRNAFYEKVEKKR